MRGMKRREGEKEWKAEQERKWRQSGKRWPREQKGKSKAKRGQDER